ncbi:MAG TPA: hypothetical protein VFG69_12135 [Nannocystaceae bacterium]|nr:hypothetical protein [Nannocystaceae bacterium]
MAARDQHRLTRYNCCVRAGAIALFVAVGCSRGSGGDDGNEGESTGAPIDVPAPDFLEPAGSELHLSVMRFEDLELDVKIAAGATDLEIDGISVGTLDPPEPIGSLTASLLRLNMSGGLVPSVHTIQLSTVDPVASEVSELIDVFIDAEPTPEIDATLADEVVATGDAAVALGLEDAGMLAVLDAGTSSLQLFAADGSGWSATAGHVAVLPGYSTAPEDRVPAIAVERDATDPDALLLAWRVGHPGMRIDAAATRWGSSELAPTVALALDPAWIGSFEVAALDRPVLAAGLLVAELEAHGDAEEPRLGDRTLASVRLGADATPGAPARAALGLFDIDGVSAAVDPLGARAAGPVALGVRLGGRPAVLEVDRRARTLAVRPSTTNDSFAALADLDGPLVTLIGAFGSRIVAGRTTDPDDIALALVDDSGAAGVRDATLDLADAELGAPTGPPAIGLVGGATVVLVPFGAEGPLLLAIIVAGDPAVRLVPEIGCDVVALPQTAAGNAAGALAFACLRDRELRLGTLALH